MKKLLSFTLIIALTLMLMASCNQNENEGGENSPRAGENQEKFSLIGEVTALGDHIEIDVIEGEHAYGIYWVLVSGETEILDRNGNEIPLEGIKIGDTVEVIYGGQVMMSYPPQIAARKVILK